MSLADGATTAFRIPDDLEARIAPLLHDAIFSVLRALRVEGALNDGHLPGLHHT